MGRSDSCNELRTTTFATAYYIMISFYVLAILGILPHVICLDINISSSLKIEQGLFCILFNYLI